MSHTGESSSAVWSDARSGMRISSGKETNSTWIPDDMMSCRSTRRSLAPLLLLLYHVTVIISQYGAAGNLSTYTMHRSMMSFLTAELTTLRWVVEHTERLHWITDNAHRHRHAHWHSHDHPLAAVDITMVLAVCGHYCPMRGVAHHQHHHHQQRISSRRKSYKNFRAAMCHVFH